MSEKFDYLIVGAGFAGGVLAERLAGQLGKTCLIAEKRNHIGGNAYDAQDRGGIRLHVYGPHYFRTNSGRVKDYLSQFTDWRAVEYKILSHTDGRFWQFPINLNTFEQFLGRPSTSEEMIATLEKWRIPIDNPQNSEECIISKVGPALYEKFFKNYTLKQWGRHPKELAADVCGRIPIRTNRDDRYFSEKFQALPKDGYAKMFEKMLRHPKIKVMLNTDYRAVLRAVNFKRMIYTGPIDEYFGHRFGRLPYRSLRFEPQSLPQEFFQPAGQVNYPNDHEFTRIVEIKHFTGQQLPVTTIVREYPQSHTPGNEPYYPIPAPDAQNLYKKYERLAQQEKNVSFVGRLAAYRYYNMDQVVGMALAEFERLRSTAPLRLEPVPSQI